MKIIRDEQLATLTLVPVETEEEQVIASIASMLKSGDKLTYAGRERDDDDGNFCRVNLHVGARHLKQCRTKGNITVRRSAYIGGLKLVLRGTTEEDKREVGRIRDTCFFGSGGLIFLGEVEVDGKKSITTTGMHCKHCGSGMIRYDDCEWKTCDVCAAKCEHIYVRGAIRGGGLEVGVGEFCDKCGRGKPGSADGMSEAEHRLAVVKEGFLDLLV